MNTKKITIGSVCFIIDKKENKVLLLKRFNEPMKGMYTGVGGKTNFDEDIQESCKREIKEETGLEAINLKLKGVLKTLLKNHESSWILFVYVTANFSGELIKCPEGELKWVHLNKVKEVNLIGFIKEIFPLVFDENSFFEGTIKHDAQGRVIKKQISLTQLI